MIRLPSVLLKRKRGDCVRDGVLFADPALHVINGNMHWSILLIRGNHICVFCTEKQLTVCHFHQFYTLTKISIEIPAPFVYNVRIAVQKAQISKRKGIILPERRI